MTSAVRPFIAKHAENDDDAVDNQLSQHSGIDQAPAPSSKITIQNVVTQGCSHVLKNVPRQRKKPTSIICGTFSDDSADQEGVTRRINEETSQNVRIPDVAGQTIMKDVAYQRIISCFVPFTLIEKTKQKAENCLPQSHEDYMIRLDSISAPHHLFGTFSGMMIFSIFVSHVVISVQNCDEDPHERGTTPPVRRSSCKRILVQNGNSLGRSK